MHKKIILSITIATSLQVSSFFPVLAAPISQAPAWAEQSIRELASAGVIEFENDFSTNGILSREEAASLVARALVKMDASATPSVSRDEEYQNALRDLDHTTRMLAKLEEMEKRAPENLQLYREEYERAKNDLDLWASRLAGAELADRGPANAEKVEKKYQAALQRFGAATRRLAQAENGARDRKEYIAQLKKQKASATQQIRNGANRPMQQQTEYTPAQRSAVENLKLEFSEELANMGYGAVEVAQRPPVNEDEKKFKVSGELRYNYAVNDGPRSTLGDDSRLRLRLYGEAQLDRNWSAHTMLESDKSFLQDNRDGHPDFDRFWLQGRLGGAFVTAGAFGHLIADGNVYDSRFKGAIFEFGDPIKLRAGWGRTNDNGMGYLASASYKTTDYDAEGGFYRYDDDQAEEKNTISYIGGNYLWGHYTLGAMYLRSSLEDSQGDRDGFVFTLGYGKLKTWRPGAYYLYAKYYDQARGTYVAHTMNGTAGYMEGFKGYGLGFYYTLAENWVYGLEYYNLEDKVTSADGRTLWNQISYYF